MLLCSGGFRERLFVYAAARGYDNLAYHVYSALTIQCLDAGDIRLSLSRMPVKIEQGLC